MNNTIKIFRKFILIFLLSLIASACGGRKTSTPIRKTIEEAVFASGYIEQTDEYLVSANADGFIQKLNIDEGQQVNIGDLLVVIEDDKTVNRLQDAQIVYQDAKINASANSLQLKQLQVQIEQVKEQLDLDKKNYKRYQELYATKSVSQLDLEKAELQYESTSSNLQVLESNYQDLEKTLKLNLKRSQTQLSLQKLSVDDFMIKAYRSGKVLKVFKKQGELVRRGEIIAKIGSGDKILKLLVAEEDITKVAYGQIAKVQLNTYPDSLFDAKITKILPAFDETEQSYIVEADLQQKPEKLFSGTQLQANIIIGKRKNVLVIPSSYLIKGKYVQLKDGEQRAVKIGIKNKTWTEIISGISEKDVIVLPKN